MVLHTSVALEAVLLDTDGNWLQKILNAICDHVTLSWYFIIYCLSQTHNFLMEYFYVKTARKELFMMEKENKSSVGPSLDNLETHLMKCSEFWRVMVL